MPFADKLSVGRKPTHEEITLSLTRTGKPKWTEDDFQRLLKTLGQAGYGWLRPEGVRAQLETMGRERSNRHKEDDPDQGGFLGWLLGKRKK